MISFVILRETSSRTLTHVKLYIITQPIIDLVQPHQHAHTHTNTRTHAHTKNFLPLINITLVYTLSAALESLAGHTLAGPRAPAAPLT